MPLLIVTPSTPPPSSIVDVNGTGFDPKLKFVLTTAVDANGAESGFDAVGSPTNINRPKRDGSFSVGITVPATGCLIRAYQNNVKVAEVSVPITTAPTAPTPTIPASIDATGATDVTSALQSYLNGLASGAKVVFKAGATYRITNGIKVVGKSNLVIDGNGATIYKTTRGNSPILELREGSNNNTIKNLTIKGVNPYPGYWNLAYEHEHGISLGGTKQTLIDSCKIINVGGDGIYFTGIWINNVLYPSQDTHITKCLFDGTGRMGIAITDGGNGVVVDFCTFRNQGYYLWDIEPNGHGLGAIGARFSDNIIEKDPFGNYETSPEGKGQPHGYFFCITGSSGGGPVENIEVSRNKITSGSMRVGIFNNGGTRKNIAIKDNVSTVRVDESRIAPIVVANGVAGYTLTGNTQPLSGGTFESHSGCTGVVISNNVTT
jgi:hypothetical protein